MTDTANPGRTSGEYHESGTMGGDPSRFESVSSDANGGVGPSESGTTATERIGLPLPGMEPAFNAPTGRPGAFGIRKIIGRDDRTPVSSPMQSPYSGILLLHYTAPNGQTLQGTGWLVRPNIAITAGHVVYDRDRGARFSTNMRAFQGVRGSTSGVPSANVVRMQTTRGWTQNGAADTDVGVVYLDRSLQGHVFTFAEFTEPDLERMNVNVVGYPVDRSLTLMQHMGQIFDARDTLLFYQMDTFGGQSGCPLIFQRTPGEYYVVGVHTAAAAGPYNQAVRIIDGVFDALHSWI